MNIKEYFKTLKLNGWLIAGVATLILITVFALGIFVGLEKARFSYNWGSNYYRNFGGPGPLPMDRNFMNAHGSDGEILKLDGNTITIKGRDGIEKNILVDSNTTIKKDRTDLKLTDLKVDDHIVVIGSPTDKGEVTAKLIRVLPEF